MKKLFLILLPALAISMATPAWPDDCYADYKAKRDNPLRLHYGIVQLSGNCSKKAARSEISARLEQRGWTLLNVLSVFDASGLDERRDSAGSFYLRF